MEEFIKENFGEERLKKLNNMHQGGKNNEKGNRLEDRFAVFKNAYKSASSRLLKKEFPAIKQKLWKDMFWSQSFCLITTGGAPLEVIKQYIVSQGQK